MGIDIKRVRAICLDVDGTLNDTDDRMTDKMARWLAPLDLMIGKSGRQKLARRLVMALESPVNLLYYLADSLGLDNLAARMFRSSDPPKMEKTVFQIIPGVPVMLEILDQHYKLAIVSARGQASTQAFLAQYKLQGHFAAIISAQSCRYTKPYPDPVLAAAEQMQVQAQECLMVGDTVVDIKAGRRAGAQTVGVLCGFGTERELRRAGVDAILATTGELIPLLGLQ